MFSVKIRYLSFFKYGTAKIVANDGKNPLHSNGELFVTLKYGRIENIYRNALVLGLNRNCMKCQCKTEFAVGLCWIFAIICHRLGIAILKKAQATYLNTEHGLGHDLTSCLGALFTKLYHAVRQM